MSTPSTTRPWRPAVVVLTGALTVALTGCSAFSDPGPRETQEREIAGVTAVELSTSGALTLETGDDVSLTVTAGRNVIDRLTSEVEDGVLHLDLAGESWGRLGPVDYHLVAPDVAGIRVDGSGSVEADLPSASTLRLDVGGSGSVLATDLAARSLQVDVDGSGSVRVSGVAERQDVRLDGSGAVDAADLRSQEANVVVNGSGDVQVHAARRLAVELSGSGRVEHTGGAAVSSTVSGSGSVTRG